jgi:hypothetical protein
METKLKVQMHCKPANPYIAVLILAADGWDQELSVASYYWVEDPLTLCALLALLTERIDWNFMGVSTSQGELKDEHLPETTIQQRWDDTLFGNHK